MTVLETVADRQAVWSATADVLKITVDRARWTSFVLSIGGALSAALSTQFGQHKVLLSIIGAIALAVAAFLTSRFLTKDSLSRHVRARAAAEALKRESYLFATNTQPYTDAASRDAALASTRQRIETDIDDLMLHVANTKSKGSCPRKGLTRDDYVKDRLDSQIMFYETTANEYGGRSKLLHTLEWVLALAAAMLAAVSTISEAGTFDWASMAAVLTTMGGAVLAHLQASKYDEIIASYRSAARRLRDTNDRLQPTGTLQQLVSECEDIISAETKSWSAMWSRG
jgi:SMODS and SLOG-associating 2TM effector domain 1/Protein of unknown function (DUF4231)